MNIWKMNGFPSRSNPYLFNGDFVDRGSFSVEVMLSLIAWKIHDPGCIFLNRGNHEGRDMVKMYGFEGEVQNKYCRPTFNLFLKMFKHLPLGVIMNKKVMVVHGGLFSNDGVTLQDLQKIERRRCIPQNGPMCDLLWSDPSPLDGKHPSKRGVSIEFGPDVSKKFLENNNLKLLVRSHQTKDEGYEIERGDQVITIFSAPNYCDQMKNKGAFIKFKEDMVPDFRKFEAVPHPNIPCMFYARNSNFMFK